MNIYANYSSAYLFSVLSSLHPGVELLGHMLILCLTVLLLLFILTDPASGLFAQTPQEDPSPGGTPVLLSSHWQTEASTMESSLGPGHLWEPETEPEPELELELQLNLQPGAWFGSWPWPLAGRAGDPW